MNFFGFLRKKWEVYDPTGKVWESYRREKNAHIFCHEMNKWAEYFNNVTFRVRRVDEQTT